MRPNTLGASLHTPPCHPYALSHTGSETCILPWSSHYLYACYC
jgi:hypothetical protein